MGAPKPKVVNCDSSVALLAAAVRTFTQYESIEQYNEACHEGTLPSCYIRLDVAHFMKLYSDFLSGLKVLKRVRIFYKAAIGELILCRNLTSAEKVLKAILIISQCESDGFLIKTRRYTQCEIQRNFLKDKIDPSKLDDTDADEITENIQRPESETILDSEYNENYSNFWSGWFNHLNEEAMLVTEEVGDHDNAYYLPEIVRKLQKDIKWFPLWSCIVRDKFGFGKIPGSSAPIESHIKNIKKDLFPNSKSKMRADVFIDALLNYSLGRSLLIEAKVMELEENVEERQSMGVANNSLLELDDNDTMEMENDSVLQVVNNDNIREGIKHFYENNLSFSV